MFWQCFGNVLDMFWTCFGHVLGMCWACFGHDLVMFQTCFGNVLAMIWVRFVYVVGIIQTWFWYHLDMLGKLFGILLHSFLKKAKNMWIPRGVLTRLPSGIAGVGCVIFWCFSNLGSRKHSWRLPPDVTLTPFASAGCKGQTFFIFLLDLSFLQQQCFDMLTQIM